jgi:hypothetical protein
MTNEPTNAQLVYGYTNPWRTALVTIWVLTFLAGLIFLITGTVLYGSYSPDAGQGDNGLVQLFFGSTLTTIGFVSLMVWIGAEMVLWKGVTPEQQANIDDQRRKLGAKDIG